MTRFCNTKLWFVMCTCISTQPIPVTICSSTQHDTYYKQGTLVELKEELNKIYIKKNLILKRKELRLLLFWTGRSGKESYKLRSVTWMCSLNTKLTWAHNLTTHIELEPIVLESEMTIVRRSVKLQGYESAANNQVQPQ